MISNETGYPQAENGQDSLSSESALSDHLKLTKIVQDADASIELGTDLEMLEVKEPEELLGKIVAVGFVLHGTTRLIKGEFVPTLAHDGAKESGNREAVYLTDAPAIAMFKSLTGGVEGRRRTEHGAVRHIEDGVITYTDLHFGTTSLEDVAEQGYVYVFGRDAVDEYIHGEFLAYKPIKPLAVVKVHREQFRYPIDQLSG